jgi:hypothetical protein
MAVGPAQPPSPEQPRGAHSSDRPPPPDGADATAEQGAEQRFGPLTIARVEKDDGRALILYSHDEEPSPQKSDVSATGPDRRDRA